MIPPQADSESIVIHGTVLWRWKTVVSAGLAILSTLFSSRHERIGLLTWLRFLFLSCESMFLNPF